MSEPENSTSNETPRGIAIDEIVLIILVVLSLIGMGITHFSPQESFMYWLVMIFTFGIAAMVAGWWQAKEKGHVRGHLIKELFFLQSLHWLGSLLTVLGVFVLLQNGRMSNETAGLVILLILGLATFLDGIRIGWRFSLAGVFLSSTALVAALVKNFVPVMIVMGVVVVAATIYLDKRRAERKLIP